MAHRRNQANAHYTHQVDYRKSRAGPSDEGVPESTYDIIRQINERFTAGPSSSPATQGPKLITRKIPQRKPTSRFTGASYDTAQQEPTSGQASTAQVDTRAQTEYAAYLAKEAEKIRSRVNVGNLPPSYNINNLYRVFEIHAGVKPLGITPRAARSCVVNFETMGLAKWAAEKVNGLQILDRNLLVTLAGETSIQKDTSDIVERINARFKKLHDPNAVIDEFPAPAPTPTYPHIDNTRKMTPAEQPYFGLNPPRATPPHRPRMPTGQHPQTRPGMPPNSIPPRQPTPPMPPHTISRHTMPARVSAPGAVCTQPRPQQPGSLRAMPLRPPPPRAIHPQGIPPQRPSLLPTPPRGMPPAGPRPLGPPLGAAPPRGPPPYAVPGQGLPLPARPNQAPLRMNPGGHPQSVAPSRVVTGTAERVSSDQKVPAVDFLIKMMNVPRKATTNDIRVFFKGLTIPPCGVEIIGGEDEVTFIQMTYHDDLLRACTNSGGLMMGQTIKMHLVTHEEIEKEKAHIMKQKQIRVEKIKQLKEQLEAKKKEAEKPRSKFSMAWSGVVEKEKTLPNTAVVLKAKPAASATAQYVRSIMIDTSKKKIGNDLFKAFKKASGKSGDTSTSTKEDAGTAGQSASGGDFTSLFDSLRQAGIQTGGDQRDASPEGATPPKRNPTMRDSSRHPGDASRSDARKDDSESDMDWQELSDASEASSDAEPQRDARSSKRDIGQARSSRHRERKYPEKRRKKDEGFYILVRNFDPELDEHDLMDFFTKRSVPVKSVIFKRMGETSSAFVRFAVEEDKLFVLAMNGRRIANLDVEIIEVTKTRFKRALATYDTPSEDQRRRHQSGSYSSDSSRSRSRSPLRDRGRSRSPIRDRGRSRSPIRDRGRSRSPIRDRGSSRSLKQTRDRSPIQARPSPSHHHMPPTTKHNQIEKKKPEQNTGEADLSFLSLFDGLRQAGIKTCDDDPRNIGPSDDADSAPQSLTQDTADNDMDCRAPQDDFSSLFDALREAGIPTGDVFSHSEPMQTEGSTEKPNLSEKDSKPPKDTGFLSLFTGLKEAGISTPDSPSLDDPKSVTKSAASVRAKPSDQAVGNTAAPWNKKTATKDDGPQPNASGTTGDSAAKGAPWTKQNPASSDRHKPGDSSHKVPKDAPWSKGNQSKPRARETDAESSFMSLFEGLKHAGIPTSDGGSSNEPKHAPLPKNPTTSDERLKPSARDSPSNNVPKAVPWVNQKQDRSRERESGASVRAKPSDQAIGNTAPWNKKTATKDDGPQQNVSGTTGDSAAKGAPWTKQNPASSNRHKPGDSSHKEPKDAPWSKGNQSKSKQSETDAKPSFMSLFERLKQAGIPASDSGSKDESKDAPLPKKPRTSDERPSGRDSPSKNDPKDAPWVKQNPAKHDIPKDPKEAPWVKKDPSTSGTRKQRDNELNDAPWAPTTTDRQRERESERSSDPKDAPWAKKDPSTSDTRKQSDDEPKDAPWARAKHDKPKHSEDDPKPTFMSLFEKLRQASIQNSDNSKSDEPIDAPWTRRKTDSSVDDGPKDAPWVKRKAGIPAGNDDPKDAPWVKSKSARWSPEPPESS